MDKAWMDARAAKETHLQHLTQYIREMNERIVALQAMVGARIGEDASRLGETVAILQNTVQRLEAHRSFVQGQHH
jgi:uncharacterized small protein (DUF1192 family)